MMGSNRTFPVFLRKRVSIYLIYKSSKCFPLSTACPGGTAKAPFTILIFLVFHSISVQGLFGVRFKYACRVIPTFGKSGDILQKVLIISSVLSIPSALITISISFFCKLILLMTLNYYKQDPYQLQDQYVINPKK